MSAFPTSARDISGRVFPGGAYCWQPKSSPRRLMGMGLTLLLCSPSFAAKPTITATASTDRVRVAEPFVIDVTVEADAGTKVAFPEGQRTVGEFDVRSVKDAFDIPAKDDAKTRTWSRELTLESLSTGDLQIPPINIHIQPPPISDVAKNLGRAIPGQVGDQVARSTVLATQPINIRVASVLEDRADPTQFRDIESVVDVVVPETDKTSVAPWAVAGFGLTALALFVGMAVHRRSGWTTPQAHANQQFDGLDPNDETVPAKLSQIVRDFLMVQFDFPENGNTPQEITTRLLDDKKFDATTAARLNGLFEIADKTKFAGLRLSNEGLASAINDSRLLIHSIASIPHKA